MKITLIITDNREGTETPFEFNAVDQDSFNQQTEGAREDADAYDETLELFTGGMSPEQAAQAGVWLAAYQAEIELEA